MVIAAPVLLWFPLSVRLQGARGNYGKNPTVHRAVEGPPSDASELCVAQGETEQIGKLLEATMLRKVGPAALKDHFMLMDTICDATQERQDAVTELVSRQEQVRTTYDPQSAALSQQNQSCSRLRRSSRTYIATRRSFRGSVTPDCFPLRSSATICADAHHLCRRALLSASRPSSTTHAVFR